MDWLATALKILEAGLSIWSNKEANKYKDRVVKIKMVIQEERAKPIYKQGMKNGTFRDDSIIDHCERELRIICDEFASSVGGANIS